MEISKDFKSISDEQLALFFERKLNNYERNMIVDGIKNEMDLWLFANICKSLGGQFII